MPHTEETTPNSPEFFGFSVSRATAGKAFGFRQVSKRTTRIVVATSPRWVPTGKESSAGRTLVAGYPVSVDGLLTLLLDDNEDRTDRDRLDVLIPKTVFKELADNAGADPVTELVLGVGVGSNDPILLALRDCFDTVRSLPSGHGDALVERLVNALNTHLAERYGGMRKPPSHSGGGLAPWQLRVARRLLNKLHSQPSLNAIALECGLSTGHFARAFKASTGKSPHQWVVQRRIEAAKDMLNVGLPLAEIAVACRFSDQSHLTRAFAQATGITPGRWRADRAIVQYADAT